jgi:hypothetical protein
MTFSYDEDDDVLNVTFDLECKNARYVETENGDIIRFSRETNQIVGVTVPFFAYRSHAGERIEIPEIGVVAFSYVMGELINHSKRTSTPQ